MILISDDEYMELYKVVIGTHTHRIDDFETKGLVWFNASDGLYHLTEEGWITLSHWEYATNDIKVKGMEARITVLERTVEYLERKVDELYH